MVKNPGLKQELERVLSEPISSVMERERNTLDRLLDACGRKVVLFGAGGLGRQYLSCLRAIGVEPLAISDNNQELWGTLIEGVSVLPPSIAAGRFGSEALFIVAIWNPRHWYSETERQLTGLGCKSVIPPSAVYWRFADTFLPFYAQDLPHKLHNESPDILAAGQIWADERSWDEYLQRVRWQSYGEWTFARSPGEESYFPDDIFQTVADEVFIDCGAFDGDTIQSFLSRRKNDFRYILGIEPDATVFAKLETYVNRLPSEIKQKITLLNCAVGAAQGSLHLQDGAGYGPSFSDNGGSVVSCAAIPDLLEGITRVTYLKMDIEGAEFDALMGARAVIECDRPVLAVCVYHRPNDLWRLPLLIKSMVPEYQMYLRSYEGDGWQTVAYAVPPDRLGAQA